MIKVENLRKTFGAKVAVDDVSFTVQKGEVLGFLGPNGAGKSTTMRMVTGFFAPTAGKVSIGGVDMLENPERAKRSIGYLPENAPLYSDMSVGSFLSFCAELRGLRGAALAKAVDHAIELCFLQSVRHQSVDTLSKGYRHRTCLAQSLIHDPEVLILDEPTDGLDPNQKHEVRALIKRMGEKKAIIFSTHILEEVEAACSRAIIIDRGKIVADGTPDQLKKRAPGADSVRLIIRGGDARAEIEKLVCVEKVEAVAGDGSSFVGRAYPTKKSSGAEVSREIGALAATRQWKVEELHHEEGKLDEVFRSITRSDVDATVPASRSINNARETTHHDSRITLPAMKNAYTIFKREFFGYFNSPVAYVILVIFVLTAMGFTFFFGNFLDQNDASLTRPFFMWHPWIFIVLGPAVGMRLWSEEHRLGTLELLMTMPISPWQGILGKFVAAALVWAIALLLTFPIVVTVFYLGNPDPGPIVSAFIGSYCYALSCLAVTCAVSAFTRSQVICFIISVTICLVLTLLGMQQTIEWLLKALPTWMEGFVRFVAYLCFLTHFYDMSKGLVALRDLLYFGSVIVICLMFTAWGLQSKRS